MVYILTIFSAQKRLNDNMSKGRLTIFNFINGQACKIVVWQTPLATTHSLHCNKNRYENGVCACACYDVCEKYKTKNRVAENIMLDSIVRACVGGKFHIKSKIYDARKRFQLDFISNQTLILFIV